jgi:hypothetical protein
MNIVTGLSGDGQLLRGRSRCSVAALAGVMGYDVLVLIRHVWVGKRGCLSMVDISSSNLPAS